MSDEMNTPIPPIEEPPGESGAQAAEAGSAWRDVVTEFDALGEAIARWAKSAVNDPENKRRLDELGDRLENLIDDVGASIKGAAESDVGQSFREAADKTGDAFKLAGQRFSDEVGPRLAGAFRTVGEKLRGAADRMEERTEAEASAAQETAPDPVVASPVPPEPVVPPTPPVEPPAPVVPPVEPPAPSDSDA